MGKVSLPALRGRVYKILSLCFQYPDEDSFSYIREGITKDLDEYLRNLPFGDLLRKAYNSLASVIKNQLSTLSLEGLQVEYTGLFITAFHDLSCLPYESIYCDDSRRLMGESVVSVKRLYNRFGLGVSHTFKDLPDHIGAELEFMFFLSNNESKFEADESDEERKLCIHYENKFLEDHMMRWIPDFVDCLERSYSSELFIHLSRFVREFVREDSGFLSSIESSGQVSPEVYIDSLEFDRSGLTTLEEVKTEPESEKWIHTTSPERYWHSPVTVKVVDGRATKIIARDDIPFFDGKQDVKAYSCFYKIYAPDRLKFPLKRVGERGAGRFKRVSWDEALSEVSDALRKYREDGHPEYVAFLRTHPPMEYMFNHFTHHYGSPNDLHTSTTSCYADGAIAQILTSGEYSDSAREDFLHSRYALFNGHNPLNALGVVTGPARYAEAIRRGMKTVIVDPRLNEGASIFGAEWVPIEPGTDAAFLLGVMNVIIHEKLYDEKFLLNHTNAPILIKPDWLPLKDEDDNYLVWDTSVDGVKPLDKALEPSLLGSYKVKQNGRALSCKTAFQLLAERVEEYPPEEASRISTIPAEKIEEIARDLGTMKPQTCVVVGTVSAQYSNSLQYQRAKQVLISLLGIIDKPGGKHYGPKGESSIKLNDPTTFRIPIKVHPMTEDRADFDSSVHPFIFTPLKNYPIGIVQNFLKAVRTGRPYPIKALFIIGSDVLSSHNPLWREAFKEVDFIVKSHVWPDDDCDYADVILPEAAYLERDDGFASVSVYNPDDMDQTFTFLTVIQKVVEPLFDVRCWHDYVKELAERIGFGEYYDFTLEEYWDYQLEPTGIDMEYLRQHGVYYPSPIRTRRIEFGKKKKWPTETGRINVYSTELARLRHERGGDPIYDPLPTYFPITVEPRKENEFYFIQGKSPYFKCNFYRDNSLLLEKYLEGEMGNTRLWINSERAATLGIEDGDWVWVESKAMATKGKTRAKVTEGIHPSAVYAYYSYGRRSKLMDKHARSREGINVQDFVPEHYVPYTGGQAHCEAVVKVYKA
jgi:thiosulfate reductase/polysulfide reductase chain A